MNWFLDLLKRAIISTQPACVRERYRQVMERAETPKPRRMSGTDKRDILMYHTLGNMTRDIADIADFTDWSQRSVQKVIQENRQVVG